MAREDNSTKLAELQAEIAGAENPMLQMLYWVLEQLMELEVSQRLNAEKSQRNESRQGYRSGYRDRRLDTLLGTVNLSVPKLRSGGYVPSFLERFQRSEKALICTIQDIYVQGVSTRKIKHLVETMGVESISAAEVSSMAKGLDEQVEAFRHRSLEEHQYPIVLVDALYEKVRVDSRVVSMAVEIVCGINEEGQREILAIETMAEESKDSYLALFRSLRERGMKTPRLVISDAHTGLVSAIAEGLPGASWQRCKVHFMRSILAHIPQKSKACVAADLKQIWLQPTAEAAREKARVFVEKYEKKYPQAVKCLEEGLEDSLTFYSFPAVDSRKISTSNMIERLNKEIRRRTHVVGIFPNEASYIRLTASLLLEYAEDWSCGRAYISTDAIATILTS